MFVQTSGWMWADKKEAAESSTFSQLENQRVTEDDQCGFIAKGDVRSGPCNVKRPFVCSKSIFKGKITTATTTTPPTYTTTTTGDYKQCKKIA